MRKTQDRIWFKKTRHSIEGRIEFHKEVACLNSGQLPFDQELKIKERIKDEIFREIYGQMPMTCAATIRHIDRVRDELVKNKELKLANQLTCAIALVETVMEQMKVLRPELEEVAE